MSYIIKNPTERKAINRICYLMRESHLTFLVAKVIALTEYDLLPSTLTIQKVIKWQRYLEGVEWVNKGLCSCCKEDTIKPVWVRYPDVSECMGCR